jgi:hypothetical protein
MIYVFGPRPAPAQTPRWLAGACALFGLSVVVALLVLLGNPVSLEGGADHHWRLGLIYCTAAVPFFFGGCAVTLAIHLYRSEAGRVYFFDLLGAALGCLALIPALALLGAINTILATAALGGVAGLLFSLSGPRHVPSRALAGGVTAGLVGLLAWNLASDAIEVHSSKGRREQDVLFSRWNSFSRVTVVGDLAERRLKILIDSDASTEIRKLAGRPDRHQLQRQRVQGLVYHVKRDGHVLVIGAGGGDDVMIARLFGLREITAVEINPIIARDVMSEEPFRSYSGAIFQQPGVRLVVDEGRSFIRRSRDRYAVIQAAMVDTWAATAAGAFALTENHLYTVEAFSDYIDHLDDDGVLAVTRWYLDPPDQMLRLVSLVRAAMSRGGLDEPWRHFVVARDRPDANERAPATLLFKRNGFSDSEVHTLEAAARRNGLQIDYTPLTRPDNAFRRLIEARDPRSVWRAFESNIEPVYDNSPFFFNSVRFKQLGAVLSGSPEWRKTNLGTLSLITLLVVSSLMVILFILGPRATTRARALRQGPGRSRRLAYLGYFACLGAGFILVEVALIQQCILFLGHPVYALAVVLFSLLVFSALGSWRSSRIQEGQLVSGVGRTVGLLVGILLLYAAILTPLFQSAVLLPRGARIVATVLLLAPVGLAMGVPMPSGIRLLAADVPDLVPWAWGINGATSVTGSIMALVVALFAGFSQVLLAGSALYVVAVLLLRRAARGTPAPQRAS